MPGAGRGGQHRHGDGAQRVEPLLVAAPQARLGELHGRADERDGGRVHGLGGPADVDDTQQLAAARVVHGAGGAGPAVVAADEVLGGEDLHRRVLGQRGADRVGADRPLGPAGALGEAQRVGPVPHPGRSLAPQQHAVRVGDDHDVPGVLGHRGQRGPQLGQHLVQQGPGPALLDLSTRRAGPGARGGPGRRPGRVPAATSARRGAAGRPADGRRTAARRGSGRAAGRTYPRRCRA